MKLLGIDPNLSATGLVYSVDGHIIEHSTLVASDRWEMVRAVHTALDGLTPDALAIEGVYLGNNPATFSKLSWLLGAIEAWSALSGRPCYILSTAEIDRRCGLSYRPGSRKLATFALASKELGNIITEHEADAYCVLVAGLGVAKEAKWAALEQEA